MTTHDPDQTHGRKHDSDAIGPHRSLLQSRTATMIAVLTSLCILFIALVVLSRW